MNDSVSGIIPVNGGKEILCEGTSLTITSIVITNPNTDYQIWMTKETPTSQTFLYRLQLNKDDRMMDTSEYRLTSGESLRLISDVNNTNFYINYVTS